MKFKATLLLSLALLAVYVAFSNGTPYLPSSLLGAFGLGESPLGFFTHIFLHVGVIHLAGNLLPLIAFSLLLETVLVWSDVLAIFLASGVLGGALFAFLNPGVELIGASAAISGLMAAAAALKPKRALVLLIAVPLIVAFALVPLVDFGEHAFESGLLEKKASLESEISVLLAQNRTAEAAQANASLQAVSAQAEQTAEGKAREAVTPSDFSVHAFGAFVGVAFLWLFRRRELRDGLNEYADLGEQLFSLLGVARGGRKKK